MSTASRPLPRLAAYLGWLLVACLCLLAATGCVRRRLTVKSNPPGALVFVDNQQIGSTPCSTDFTYYGTREIRLVKSGYETLTVNQPIPTPWYQVPPLDFISDNLWPIPIRDNRTVEFPLQPLRMQSFDEVMGRGNELRSRVQQASATGPLGPAVATPALPGPVLGPAPATTAPNVFPPPSLGPPSAAPFGTPINTLPSPPGGFIAPTTTLPPTSFPPSGVFTPTPTTLPTTTLPATTLPATTLPALGPTMPSGTAPAATPPAPFRY